MSYARKISKHSAGCAVASDITLAQSTEALVVHIYNDGPYFHPVKIWEHKDKILTFPWFPFPFPNHVITQGLRHVNMSYLLSPRKQWLRYFDDDWKNWKSVYLLPSTSSTGNFDFLQNIHSRCFSWKTWKHFRQLI